jgi:rubrerythrin
MTLPNMDQTEGIWIERTKNQGYHYIQEVFSRNTQAEQAHRMNCRKLIQRGSLQPEHTDHLVPSQREWDGAQRYSRVHI